MIQNLQRVRKLSESLDGELESLKIKIEEKQKEYQERIANISKLAQSSTELNQEEFLNFLKEPYVIIPHKEQEWYVAVPKMFKMHLGWLDHTTDTYNIFKINKFMKWLGNIPVDLQKNFKFKREMPLKILDGTLFTGKTYQDRAWNNYNKFLTRREGKDKIKIRSGYEFKLLAKLIDDGILPFIPQPIDDQDLRDYELEFKLRGYQQEAWDKFKEVGAVGIYWAYSAGKTFFGLYAGARIKGKKIVVVPTRTLVEQWQDRIREYLLKISHEFNVVTYHSFSKLKNKKYALVIYDEVQHLPANTFSRFATLKTKYRIGLSATPYREDGRTDYIFALTGFPIGLAWESLIELGVFEVPDIRVYILKNWQDKEKKLAELLRIDKKTIIFCDGIALGKRLSKRFEIPFIHGQTRKRLETIKESDVSIISRVGDEGLSIAEIQRVIEVDFLFGSRRQEGQRLGRLFHGEEKGEHIILMTESEYDKYNKRLYAIYEKGFKMEIIR